MIKELNDMLPKDEQEKLPKFYSNIMVAEENIENVRSVIKLLAEYELTFLKAVDLRTLTIEEKVLYETIEKYRSKGKFNIIKNDISLLRYESDIILKRIEDCEKVGKGYLDENGRLQQFILNDDEWERVAKGLRIDEIGIDESENYMTLEDAFDQFKIQFINDALELGEINLDIEEFEKYTELVRAYEGTIKAIGTFTEETTIELAEGFIMNLVAYRSTFGSYITDQDIVYAALIRFGKYSKEEIESIIPIINSLIEPEDIALERSEIIR